MTRANALGTSYALMENADIVEGKYRDATFDSKTSAYCAADADYSKQNPYDLVLNISSGYPRLPYLLLKEDLLLSRNRHNRTFRS